MTWWGVILFVIELVLIPGWELAQHAGREGQQREAHPQPGHQRRARRPIRGLNPTPHRS